MYNKSDFSQEDRGETRPYFTGETRKPHFVTVSPSTLNYELNF